MNCITTVPFYQMLKNLCELATIRFLLPVEPFDSANIIPIQIKVWVITMGCWKHYSNAYGGVRQSECVPYFVGHDLKQVNS